MSEKLTADTVYTPVGGMNPDSNGVSAMSNEAFDIVNCNVETSGFGIRAGTQLLGSPPANEITVVGAGDGDVNQVYTYLNTGGGAASWLSADEVYVIIQNENGTYSIGSTVFTYDGYNNPGTGTVPDKTNWVVGADGTGPAPTLTYALGVPAEPVLEYHLYTYPAGGTILFAFCANGVYRYADGVGWTFCLDPLVTTYTWEQWSITNVVDKKLGATVVAAASQYTLPTGIYNDGAERSLLYYDIASGLFKDFQLYSDILGEEDVGPFPAMPNNKGGIVTSADVGLSPISNLPIIPATCFAVLDGVGVIAEVGLRTFDNDDGTTFQYLLPVEGSGVLFSSNSIVNLDTGAWSMELVDDRYNAGLPANLFFLYSYESAVTYRPLYVSNYHGALVMANTSEYILTGPEAGTWEYFPWRVRWTEQSSIDLAPQGNFQELVLDDITPILAMKSLATEASSTIFGPLYFYKHNSIIRGTYNQNFNLNPAVPLPMFSFEIAYPEGIEATRTITSINRRHFFLGRNDVYVFDGVNRISLTEKDGNTRVQRYIFDNLDFNDLEKCFGEYDDINRKYMLFLKFKSNSGDYATDVLVYDTDLNQWSRYIMPETSAAISADLEIRSTISQLAGTIDGLEGKIEDLLSNTRKLFIFAQTDLSFYAEKTNGYDKTGWDPIEYSSYVITRDFLGDTLEEQDRVQRVYIEGRYDEAKINIHGNYAEAPGWFDPALEQTLQFPTTYRRETFSPDLTCIHARFYIQVYRSAIVRWIQVFSNRQEFTNE